MPKSGAVGHPDHAPRARAGVGGGDGDGGRRPRDHAPRARARVSGVSGREHACSPGCTDCCGKTL